MVFSRDKNEEWKNMNKIIFRLLFTYFVLFVFLLIFAFILETPLRWFAQNILDWGGEFSMDSTGSGDRSFDYVRFAANIFLTILIVPVWAFFDRSRVSFDNLFYAFQVLLRIFLFLAMCVYGFAKIFKGQFPDPSLVSLLRPLGDMSPMGLAWNFMGYSFFYNLFIGSVEVFGGLMLLFRRTQSLGSIVIAGTMVNVAMMNFTYDIPVKLFSVHLLMMAVLLMLTDGRRLWRVFISNETVSAVVHSQNPGGSSFQKILSAFKTIIVTVTLGIITIQCIVRFDIREQLKSKSEFYGIWESQQFVLNQDTIPPILTHFDRWRYLIVDQKNKMTILSMDDSLENYDFTIDLPSKEISFSTDLDSLYGSFSYSFFDDDSFQMKGRLGIDSLNMLFKRKSIEDFRLIRRKFHWINESTYNY